MNFIKNLSKNNNDATSGVVLIIATVVAMFCANNNATQQAYQAILAIPVKFQFGILDINKALRLWINDVLMVPFFLTIGLEIKRELMIGYLKGCERALFPLIAAFGGMLVPALIYAIFNHNDALAIHGWAIPVATDIAFALGILALLGNLIHPALKVFLMALAVIDDLGSIVIIAFFYTSDFSMFALGVAFASIAVLALLNISGVGKILAYLIVGIVLWIAVLQSGINTTLADVIVSLFIPLKRQDGTLPLVKLVHSLYPWVSWLILPIFAFANAGVSFRGLSLSLLFSMVPLGIIFGLLVGKPLGITLSCWLAVRLKIAVLPRNIKMADITAISILCGIGFTMSIFIASLAFDALHQEMAKLGILIGSVLSAMLGYFVLRTKLQLSYN